jgi:mannan endo-1,4-beta-mannosidase
VTRNGGQLILNGQPYHFSGLNAYEAATDWGVNAGCGQMLTDSDLSNLFAGALKANQVVRFWAFQALATNYTTKQLDWTGIDRVINTASRYGVKVVPALSGQSGGCDDNHWKDVAWYTGGYMNVYDPTQWPNSTPLSFWDYMHDFLNRYGANPNIAMIELVSEPTPTDPGYVCTGENTAANALRYFFDMVGIEAKKVDPNHLFESGEQGVGQCGLQDSGCATSSWTSCSTWDYQYVNASSGVDVNSYHDYGQDTTPLPGYLAESLALSTQYNVKPLIVGELGMNANSNVTGCMTLTDRANETTAKLNAQFSAGVSGITVWDFIPGSMGSTCTYDVAYGDPVLQVIQLYG